MGKNVHPYIILLIFGMAQVVLVWLRRYLIMRRKRPEVQPGNAQTIGRRKEQEDAMTIIANEDGVLAVVADGMGGYSDGKLTSGIVVNTFTEEFARIGEGAVESFLKNTTTLCNQKIQEKWGETRAGSTLLAAVISRGLLHWVSVGDSAIILYRHGELNHLNKKHIFQAVLEQQYLAGEISREEMRNNRKKKRLTSYIGRDGLRELETNRKPLPLFPGDQVILCSDGVYNSISELEMEEVLSRFSKPNVAAAEIIARITAKNFINQDNATIIILKMK
jgi:serine/threonine protein phosphatase PrpC